MGTEVSSCLMHPGAEACSGPHPVGNLTAWLAEGLMLEDRAGWWQALCSGLWGLGRNNRPSSGLMASWKDGPDGSEQGGLLQHNPSFAILTQEPNRGHL